MSGLMCSVSLDFGLSEICGIQCIFSLVSIPTSLVMISKEEREKIISCKTQYMYSLYQLYHARI